MEQKTGIKIRSKQDLENNLETIKIYVRGHNLYDIFYGRYKGEQENEILIRYIQKAPRKVDRFLLNIHAVYLYSSFLSALENPFLLIVFDSFVPALLSQVKKEQLI
mgnify:CR=1 FL=1